MWQFTWTHTSNDPTLESNLYFVCPASRSGKILPEPKSASKFGGIFGEIDPDQRKESENHLDAYQRLFTVRHEQGTKVRSTLNSFDINLFVLDFKMNCLRLRRFSHRSTSTTWRTRTGLWAWSTWRSPRIHLKWLRRRKLKRSQERRFCPRITIPTNSLIRNDGFRNMSVPIIVKRKTRRAWAKELKALSVKCWFVCFVNYIR